MQCPTCGIVNRDDAKFCTRCGSTLTPAGGARGAKYRQPGMMLRDMGADETLTGEAPVSAEPSNVVTVSSEAIPPGAPFIEVVFLTGLRKGEKLVLSTFPATVGRDPGSMLQMDLNDTLASTRHAHLLFEGNRFILRDIGSTNGTYHKGNRVKEIVLAHGDVIEFGIGGPKLRFDMPWMVATPPPVLHVDSFSGPAIPGAMITPKAERAPGPVLLQKDQNRMPETPRGNDIPAWARNAPPPPELITPRPQPDLSSQPGSPQFLNRPIPEPQSETPFIPSTVDQGSSQAGLVTGGNRAAVSYPGGNQPQSVPDQNASAQKRRLMAVIKLILGFGLLILGAVVAIVFKSQAILVGFMACVMVLGIGIAIWGAAQLILGNSKQ